MARKWLRGPCPFKSGGNYHQISRGTHVFLYFYFRYLLGYQFLEESVAGAFSFNGCEDSSGIDGIFAGTDFVFTKTGGTAFTAGDIGKFIVINDTNGGTGEQNSGIYEIKTFIDANNVTIDFYSSDFPSAQTAMSWWLVDSTIGANLEDNDFTVWRVNHATVPYEFQIYMPDSGGDDRLFWRFAADQNVWSVGSPGSWDTSGPILYYDATYNPNGKTFAPHNGYFNDLNASRIYAFGDSEGDLCWLTFHTNKGTGLINSMTWFVIDPIFETSPARDHREKFGVTGGTWYNTYRNSSASDAIDQGRWWSERLYPGCYTLLWSGWNFSNTSGGDWFYKMINQPNHRDGSEFDGLPIWLVTDPGPSENSNWAIIGAIPKEHLWLTACRGIGDMTTFGSNDYFHLVYGITIPWPGLQHT